MNRLKTTLLGIVMPIVAFADPITPTKALEISQRYLLDGQTQTLEMCAKRSGRFDDMSQAKGGQATYSSPYYIISRGEGNGFVIVSGDDCLPEVLGVVEHGDYDENDMPESFREWLQYRAAQVEYAQAKGVNTPFVSTAVVSGRESVDPLIETLWHQTSPYNDRCPRLTSNGNRAVTGCVATAASQIAYYWRRDARTKTHSTTPTYSYGDAPVLPEYQIKAGTPLKWDLMQKKYGSEPAEYKDAVATLVAMMGMSCGLTYGSSTGGQISDMVGVFNNQIGINGGVCVYKSGGEGLNAGMTEEKWSELLYNQLIRKRPVLYCGYNSGSGGHAVVCDGYQASTGFFHINFGWGDGYNGFFSVEDGVKGWGFNESWTGCVYDIYANKPNVTVEMETPEHVYKNAEARVRVTLTNRATLPLKGVYLFAQTSSTPPAKLTSAKSSYLEEIPVDATAEFDMTLTAPTEATYNIFLTDENLNVIGTSSFKSESTEASLCFNGISVATSSETEMMGSDEYGIVYNTATTVKADIMNTADKPYYGIVILDVFGYNSSSGEWEKVGNGKATSKFDAKKTSSVTFSLSNSTSMPLKVGNYYYAVLSDSISATSRKVKNVGDAANIVRFKFANKDMAVVSFTDNILKLKGHFDQTLFNSSTFAKSSKYKTAQGYDLTECQGVLGVSQDVNPNALYYVSPDSKAEGNNVVKDGHVTKLVLTPGYDFVAKVPFSIDSTVVMSATVKPGQWYMLTAPAELKVHRGMVAREIAGHSTTTGLSGKVNDVNTLVAGKTYLLMSSTADNNTICGGASKVAIAPATNLDATVKGNYVSTVTETGGLMMQMGSDGLQYLQPVAAGTEVEALRGYMLDKNVTTAVRTIKHTAYDKYYLTLVTDINKANRLIEKYSGKAPIESVYTLRSEIKTAIEVFSYREADVNNLAIRPAYERLETACLEFLKSLYADAVTNSDCTSAIKNPSFESKSVTGWTVGSSTYAKAVVGTGNNALRGVGIDGSYLLNNLIASDSTSVSLEQKVQGLVPGIYRLSAKVGTGAGRKVTMFAGDNTVTVGGHPFGNLYLNDAVIENIKVLADEGSETGSLTIGIKQGDWYKADNFRLILVSTLNDGIRGDLNGDGIVSMQDVNIAINRGFLTEDVNAIVDTYLGK